MCFFEKKLARREWHKSGSQEADAGGLLQIQGQSGNMLPVQLQLHSKILSQKGKEKKKGRKKGIKEEKNFIDKIGKEKKIHFQFSSSVLGE